MEFTGGKHHPSHRTLTPSGSLKQFLRSSYKPTNLQQLMNGIEEFWQSLTSEVCRKYIQHLHKVMPKVVEVDGNPSGLLYTTYTV